MIKKFWFWFLNELDYIASESIEADKFTLVKEDGLIYVVPNSFANMY